MIIDELRTALRTQPMRYFHKDRYLLQGPVFVRTVRQGSNLPLWGWDQRHLEGQPRMKWRDSVADFSILYPRGRAGRRGASIQQQDCSFVQEYSRGTLIELNKMISNRLIVCMIVPEVAEKESRGLVWGTEVQMWHPCPSLAPCSLFGPCQRTPKLTHSLSIASLGWEQVHHENVGTSQSLQQTSLPPAPSRLRGLVVGHDGVGRFVLEEGGRHRRPHARQHYYYKLKTAVEDIRHQKNLRKRKASSAQGLVHLLLLNHPVTLKMCAGWFGFRFLICSFTAVCQVIKISC